MKTKLLALLTITVITLLTTSYTYACISVNPQTSNNPDIEFATVTATDNENTNAANIHAQITPDHETINIQITNAYPNYEAQITYTLKNTGNTPIQFTTTPIITNPNPQALQIATTNHKNTILQPSQTTPGTTTVHIQSTAQQNHHYTFQITNTATAITPPPEPCHPHTSTFCRDQFQLHLTCKSSQAKIDASALEQYLSKISTQSKIFKFTGTQTQKFQQALNTLNPPNNANTETKLKTQLLTIWLNQMAGWTTDYRIDNKASNLIIQNSETTLQNHQTSLYQTWKLTCEQFNNLT